MSETVTPYIPQENKGSDMPPVLIAQPESANQSEAPKEGRLKKALKVLHRTILAPILGK